jgi:hypothetical protein
LGPWRACKDEVCQVDIDGRTLKVSHIDVSQPSGLRGPLTETLGEVIDSGDLNILIQLGHELSWIIQGVHSGRIDGENSFGQGEGLGAYCGPSSVTCQNNMCTTTFRPDRTTQPVILSIRNPGMQANDPCAYQTLELVDVEINAVINIGPIPGFEAVTPPSSVITLSGALSSASAARFTMSDGQRLVELMRASTEDAWDPEDLRVQITGVGVQVHFDNDPTQGFDSVPSESTPSETMTNEACH